MGHIPLRQSSKTVQDIEDGGALAQMKTIRSAISKAKGTPAKEHGGPRKDVFMMFHLHLVNIRSKDRKTASHTDHI